MKATKLFNSWVENGKDEGMEKNHSASVNEMIKLVPKYILNNSFSFLDFGCGNGWLVRKFTNYDNCIKSTGIDGAPNMIKKAISNDNESKYIQFDLDNIFSFNQKFDLIMSMEVMYYLKNPELVINHINKNMLNPGGFFIMGIDFYEENKSSLSWPSKLDVEMFCANKNKWKDYLSLAGFDKVRTFQFGKKNDWAGTLVLSGEKL